MKIKIKVLYESWQSLIAISILDLPVGFSFDIKEILKSKEGVVHNVEHIRSTLVKKYGTENTRTVEKDGKKTEVPTGSFSFDSENKQKFDNELGVVFNKDATLDITPIKVKDLGSELKIKPSVLLALDWLIVK